LAKRFCCWYEDISGDFGRGRATCMMPSCIKKICNIFKKNIYRLYDIKRLEQDIKSCCNLTHTSYKMHENWCSTVRVICTCAQCDSAFCALQLTALIKHNWYVLLHCCACLHPNTILMEAGWTAVQSPATNLSILTCKSSARTKHSVISVALETPLEIRLGICIYKISLLHRPDDYIGFTPSCPPIFYNKIAPM